MNFPVLKFGHDEFFEDVIIAVRDLIHRDSDYRRTELLIGQMLEGDLSPRHILLEDIRGNYEQKKLDYFFYLYLSGNDSRAAEVCGAGQRFIRAKLLQKSLSQHGNILFSLPKRRQRKGQHIYPIVEIFPEFSFSGQLQQILIGRRYNPHIYPRGKHHHCREWSKPSRQQRRYR